MPNISAVSAKNSTGYARLRQQVRETLLLGWQRIEEARVETYLETGKLIDEHIFKNGSRDEHYGREIIERLSADLEVSASVLWRCLQFARTFKKILARGRESFPARLSWSHYRQLITIPDENLRLAFMQRAQKGGWSAEELGGKIRLEVESRGAEKADHASPQTQKERPYPKLIPKRGQLYTYRLIAPDSLHDGDDRLWIDLGFQAHRKVPAGTRGLKAGGIVESSVSGTGGYALVSSRRAPEDLFTYKGFVERVVDGDTLIVKIDLGFELRIRQYLRLRGIDAPELSTEAGRKAKAFVERALSRAPHVILTSSRSDKYDRYLANVFVTTELLRKTNNAPRPTGAGVTKEEYIFLNQALLDAGLAERMS